jgi:hypothetical protein
VNWKKATLGQLYEIAYNDDGAAPIYKRNALALDSAETGKTQKQG